MVLRKLNKPVFKIGKVPVFWFNEVKVEWFCKKCYAKCGPKTDRKVAFELWMRQGSKGGKDDEPFKIFLCLPCAQELLKESLAEVTSAMNLGPNAYQVFKQI